MTNISGVATRQQYDSLLDAMRTSKGEIAKINKEVGSGFKTEVYASGSGRTGISLELRGRKDLLDTYMVSNKVVAEKQQTAATLLGNVRELGQGLRETLFVEQSYMTDQSSLQEAARSALEGIIAQLNTPYGGEFLFSGRAVTTPSFISDGAGGFVYQGDTAGQLEIHTSETKVMTVAPRADTAAVMKIIDTLTRISTTDLSVLSKDDLRSFAATAIADVSEGIEGVLVLEGELGNRQKRLDEHITAQERLSISYNATIREIEGVDMEEAAIRLKSATAQLDSTYAVTAQMSRLSLLNHI